MLYVVAIVAAVVLGQVNVRVDYWLARGQDRLRSAVAATRWGLVSAIVLYVALVDRLHMADDDVWAWTVLVGGTLGSAAWAYWKGESGESRTMVEVPGTQHG
jgi:hypothetical protein